MQPNLKQYLGSSNPTHKLMVLRIFGELGQLDDDKWSSTFGKKTENQTVDADVREFAQKEITSTDKERCKLATVAWIAICTGFPARG